MSTQADRGREGPGGPRRASRRSFSPQFKAEAVAMVVELGKTAAQVARDLELNESTVGRWVHRWRTEHGEGSAAPLRPAQAARLVELEEANRQLELENRSLNYQDFRIIQDIKTSGICRLVGVAPGWASEGSA